MNEKTAQWLKRFPEQQARGLVESVETDALDKLAEAYFAGVAEANQDLRRIVASTDLPAALAHLEADPLYAGTEKRAAAADLEQYAAFARQVDGIIEAAAQQPYEKQAEPKRPGLAGLGTALGAGGGLAGSAIGLHELGERAPSLVDWFMKHPRTAVAALLGLPVAATVGGAAIGRRVLGGGSRDAGGVKTASAATEPARDDDNGYQGFFREGFQPLRHRQWKKLDIPPSSPGATEPDRL